MPSDPKPASPRPSQEAVLQGEGSPSGSGPAGRAGPLILTLFLVYAVATVRTGWLSEDAFVSFRALDNLRHGYGLLSNPPERVMGFTNPLWSFVVYIPFRLGMGIYPSAMLASFACAALTALVVARAARGVAEAAAAMLWFALSGAYVDFSTSGLENPLAHLLLAIFFVRFLGNRHREDLFVPFFLTSAVMLNRMDHGLLLLPALAVLCLERGARGARCGPDRTPAAAAAAALTGLSPLGIWLLFSLFYYGFPFPNTAYAKLNNTLPAADVTAQGVSYLVDSIRHDPVTPLVTALAVFSAARARSREGLAVSAGLLLHLAYIIYIGGDFMRGRFFSAPFLVSVVWLSIAGFPAASRQAALSVYATTVVLGLLFTPSFVRNDEPQEKIPPSGIIRERLWYLQTALYENVRVQGYKQHPFYQEGRRLRKLGKRSVIAVPNVGLVGYAAGPRVHVIDRLALTDPLLARIPFSWPDKTWRIGHFPRGLPAGYEESIRSGENRLRDPCLHAYYDVLVRVIRGPLFSWQRLRDIWDLNTGRYDDLVRKTCRQRR